MQSLIAYLGVDPRLFVFVVGMLAALCFLGVLAGFLLLIGKQIVLLDRSPLSDHDSRIDNQPGDTP